MSAEGLLRFFPDRSEELLASHRLARFFSQRDPGPFLEEILYIWAEFTWLGVAFLTIIRIAASLFPLCFLRRPT